MNRLERALVEKDRIIESLQQRLKYYENENSPPPSPIYMDSKSRLSLRSICANFGMIRIIISSLTL